MGKAEENKPAGSRGIVSSLGTLVLAFLLLAFGFWAGRTFETLWPSGALPPPRPSVAVSTVPPSTLPSHGPTPSAAASAAASPAPSPAVSPSLEAAVVEKVPAPASRSARRSGARDTSTAAQAPRAGPAPAPALAAPTLPGRPFLFGTSVVESLKPPATEVPGFETSGVGVKRAPEVPGRVDFEVSPRTVKAGDRYAVKVFLVNDGGKVIAIDALDVAMVADGRRSARALPPRSRSVAPRQRALLAELPGVWQDGLGSWALEVAITSKRQDRYTNTLNWK